MRWLAPLVALLAVIAAACSGAGNGPAPTPTPSVSTRSLGGETFIDGVVVAVGEGKLTVHPIDDREGPPFQLQVTGETRIWKGLDVGMSEVEIGDRAFVKARELEAGGLQALTVYLNLVRASGKIVYRHGDTMVIQGTPEISPHTDVAVIRAQASTIFEGGGRDDLEVGRGVDVIGVQTSDGSITATRIFLAGAADPTSPP